MRNESVFAEIQERWSRMPRSNRVWLACLIALTLVIGVLSINFRQMPQREMLLGGQHFTARELISLEGAFAQAKLADYEILNQQVEVPRARRNDYVAALTEAQILPSAPGNFPASSSPLFESTGQRTARERGALERELSACVRRFQDIEDASVRIDEATVGQGFQRTRKVTSMVVLQPTESPLTSQRVRSICRLVASAKVELGEQDVTVTDLSTGRCFRGANDIVLQREDMERELSQRIETALQFVPGVRVATSVRLVSESSAMHEPSVNASVAAVEAVAVSVGVPTSYYHAVWNKHRELVNSTFKDPPEDTTLAAIEHETRERIVQTVRPLLPIKQGAVTDGPSQVTVVSVPDVSAVAATDAPLVHSGFADWLRSHLAWSLLVLLGATLLGFYALRGIASDMHRLWVAREEHYALRVIRETELREFDEQVERRSAAQSTLAASAANPPEISIAPAISSEPERVLVEASKAATDEVFSDGTSPIHDELTRIVRDNPDAAASILKNWIDKAG